jgi:glycosyltransferase involved in cell wall biosynthesis
MNIIFVGTLLPHRGGSGITSSLLLAGLVRSGHKVRAVAPITADLESGDDPMSAWCPEIAVSRYTVPYFETDSVESPVGRCYREEERRQIRTHVLRLFGSEPADIILVGRESFVYEIPGLAKRLGRPWILRLGGHLLMGLAEGRFPCGEADELKRCFHSADLVLAQAEHLRPAAERLGCREIAVIPNLVDLEQFAPRPKPAELCRALGIRSEDVVVMHASNLKPLKRVADLVESAPATLAANPRVIYVIVGDGACRPALERMVSEKGLQDRFHFTGWVDYSRIPDYLAVADIVAMPSEREQQARIYLETQAMGRVLIASDIPGSRSVVEHGRDGLLFRKGDAGALAFEVSRAAADPVLRAAIGSRARERAADRSMMGICGLLAATMQAVVERHAAGRPV